MGTIYACNYYCNFLSAFKMILLGTQSIKKQSEQAYHMYGPSILDTSAPNVYYGRLPSTMIEMNGRFGSRAPTIEWQFILLLHVLNWTNEIGPRRTWPSSLTQNLSSFKRCSFPVETWINPPSNGVTFKRRYIKSWIKIKPSTPSYWGSSTDLWIQMTRSETTRYKKLLLDYW